MNGRRPHIVLGTDRDWLAASIEGVLDHDRFEVLTAASEDELEDLVDGQLPDVVLLDQELAASETPGLCRRLVQGPLGERVPLVVYSSDLRDEDLQMSSIESGAWTVIQEPIRSRYLLATLQRFLQIGRAARGFGREEASPGARRRTTELPELGEILMRLPALEALAEREGTTIALVAVGPRQLASGELRERQRQQMAELCREVLRRADLCGWLDDEGDVVIAAYGTSREGARRLAERLAVRAAEKSEIERPEDALSVGVVELRPGEDLEEVRAGKKADDESKLVEAAHEALHRARQAGGGIEFVSRV